MRLTYTSGSPHDAVAKQRSDLEQAGVVRESSNRKIRVSINNTTGCSGCHTGLCVLGKLQNGELELEGDHTRFSVGDPVLIRIKPSSGYAAMGYLYLAPFILMILTLVVLLNGGYHELPAGIASLLVLLPYFLLVFAFRKKLAARCDITIDWP
jgi:sigma-E factor negative regulatory protein RseC